MPTTIKLKNSVTTTSVPSSLVQGEVAINITDKKVWVGNAATTPIQIAGAGTTGNAAGSNTQVQYNSSGSFAGSANFTFNGTTVTMANDASISGLTVGKGGGAVSSNTAVGFQAHNATATGGNNTGVGMYANYAVTSGSSNTGLGFGANASVSTGVSNTGVGHAALNNSTGSFNSALGNGALQSNTTASNNTAVGYQAGYSNTTGTENNAFGYQSLRSTTTGNSNNGFGNFALFTNTTGTNNVAMGHSALYYNTTGGSNVGLGYQALVNNTTASNNTAVGQGALLTNATSENNTAVGKDALEFSTGGYNTGIGAFTFNSLTTGTYNTAIGAGSGDLMTTGSKNTILGSYRGNNGGLDIRTLSNYIVLSDGDGNPRGVFNNNGTFFIGAFTSPNGTQRLVLTADGSAGTEPMLFNELRTSSATENYVRFYRNGNQVGSITNTLSATAYVTSSDYRLKENVQPMTGALATVAQLKPVTYKWKATGENGQGFIAHELQAVVPDAVSGEKDAVDADGNIKPQGIDTSFLVATLTAAIQELKVEVDSLKAQLNK